ncbi:7-cyano-7-deazaguanine synthase QueC [Paraburkholderia sp. CNPSo 3157]|uniref:7-cyano-7-deazaguanine synthase n=1 Tax=Paraburkholderia franconis TaxID=2654983 RepID=A0A7X1TIF1_9BURK|nr:7-cyano-7-deazaguanine synthase QueC [Paraburkholderia franconis]MPW20159.1 7-cyano-7-deazaguanine synthase QueC [Paraburkholderia franconis]
MKPHALVLFSGGQDSTTCLAWALDRYQHVETIGFDYGQRHAIELECRPKVLASLRERFPAWAGKLGDDHMLDLSILGQVSDTALTAGKAIEMQANGLPNTFVPGRNLLFFTLAAAVAYRRGLQVLVGGMCETDYSGYPDCRDATLKALQVAIGLGMDTPLVIETPLMWIDKAETWHLVERLGGTALVDLVCEQTHTCYIGDRSARHVWGYGCGQCPACKLREKGFDSFSGWRSDKRGAAELARE